MSKYIKPERKGQIIFIVCILLAIVIGLVWNAIDTDRRTVAPDATYPMANAHIGWEQTYHGGAWNE